MHWEQDVYEVSAGDVAAAYASRGYNVALGRWESLPGLNLTPYGAHVPSHRLKHVEVRVRHAAGTAVAGVKVFLGCAIDQKRPGELWTLGCPVHSGARSAVVWQGDMPLGGGVVWRIALGGLIATDLVSMAIGYE